MCTTVTIVDEHELDIEHRKVKKENLQKDRLLSASAASADSVIGTKDSTLLSAAQPSLGSQTTATDLKVVSTSTSKAPVIAPVSSFGSAFPNQSTNKEKAAEVYHMSRVSVIGC